MVAFCPFQNNGAWRGAYPNAAKLTTRGNRESNPGSRCFVEDKRPLCQFSAYALRGQLAWWRFVLFKTMALGEALTQMPQS